jgi:hypothetical protein
MRATMSSEPRRAAHLRAAGISVVAMRRPADLLWRVASKRNYYYGQEGTI